MTETAPPRQLPVRLPPYPDELLSSWISRHAAFYAVPPLVMLQHCLPEASSLRAVDLDLKSDQEIRLAYMFAIEPAVLRQMTFINVPKSSHRFIASKPAQTCTRCSPGGAKPAPTLRSHLLGWRITCPHCGALLRGLDDDELPSPFQQYHRAALRGEKLLDDEAERGSRAWTSPTEIARLLLMRRVIWPLPREHELWRFRVLGTIIPDLDHVVAKQQQNLPTPAKPILSLYMRPALLAGVAIVERAGPEMLRMLRRHMMGDNRVRFTDAAESMIARSRSARVTPQMQLI
ncbi:MAG: TniQ family protein [Afipia sp.]|nr:TniQ family protein [Afipia sp.]